MSAAKDCMKGCFNVTFGTNYSRLIWATVLHALGIVLTVINLAVATDKPTSALSFAKFDIDQGSPVGDVHYEMGLLKFQRCSKVVDYCETVKIDSGTFPDSSDDYIQGGNGVIVACTFAMVFALASIIILWLWIIDRADKLKFPRIILQITNFLSLTLYIVAVSTYYKLTFNGLSNLHSDRSGNFSRNVQPGYSIALLIVAIVCAFFAWAFTFWRVCRPNKNEPAREKKPKAEKKKDETTSSSSALETGKAQQEAAVEGQTAEEPAVSSSGGAYGNSYSNGGSYGQSSGGYGGAYSSAYGNGSSYSNDDNSSYGNSGGAYANSGGAYSNNKESAYGY